MLENRTGRTFCAHCISVISTSIYNHKLLYFQFLITYMDGVTTYSDVQWCYYFERYLLVCKLNTILSYFMSSTMYHQQVFMFDDVSLECFQSCVIMFGKVLVMRSRVL